MTACGSSRFVVALVLALPGPALAQTVDTCLADTGYALVGTSGAAVTGNDEPSWLFTSPPGAVVFCAPPHEDLLERTSTSGSAIVGYLAGTGLALATGALANPSDSQFQRGFLRVTFLFEFQVLPDDPAARDPVEITVTSWHAFSKVAVASSGSGQGFNQHEGFYELRRFSRTGMRIGAPWDTDGLVPVEGASSVLAQPLTVPIATPLFLLATVAQESAASGNFGAQTGSGAAEQSSTVTFEVTTDAAASVVFALEERLGLPAPRLGVVTVPEPGAGWGQIAALSLLGVARRRSARASGAARSAQTASEESCAATANASRIYLFACRERLRSGTEQGGLYPPRCRRITLLSPGAGRGSRTEVHRVELDRRSRVAATAVDGGRDSEAQQGRAVVRSDVVERGAEIEEHTVSRHGVGRYPNQIDLVGVAAEDPDHERAHFVGSAHIVDHHVLDAVAVARDLDAVGEAARIPGRHAADGDAGGRAAVPGPEDPPGVGVDADRGDVADGDVAEERSGAAELVDTPSSLEAADSRRVHQRDVSDPQVRDYGVDLPREPDADGPVPETLPMMPLE